MVGFQLRYHLAPGKRQTSAAGVSASGQASPVQASVQPAGTGRRSARQPRFESAALLERGVYAGELFVFERTDLTLELVRLVREALSACCVDQAPGAGFEELTTWPCPKLPFERMAAVRERLYENPYLHQLAARIVRAAGFDASTSVDVPRLRVINQGAEELPNAAPLFVLHRDTWYACPESQINWWVPIFDTPVEQAFGFYPEHFDAAVENSSSDFSYERWTEDVGWHGTAPLSEYPAPTRFEPRGEPVRFDFKAGDLLLFSAAHLHRTLPNPVADSSRLSLDFRSVTVGARGARNVDNASSGAAERVRREFVPIRYLAPN